MNDFLDNLKQSFESLRNVASNQVYDKIIKKIKSLPNSEVNALIGDSLGWELRKVKDGERFLDISLTKYDYLARKPIKSSNNSAADNNWFILPRYTDDLDVMRRLENTLEDDDIEQYWNGIIELFFYYNVANRKSCFKMLNQWALVHASARIKAESFLILQLFPYFTFKFSDCYDYFDLYRDEEFRNRDNNSLIDRRSGTVYYRNYFEFDRKIAPDITGFNVKPAPDDVFIPVETFFKSLPTSGFGYPAKLVDSNFMINADELLTPDSLKLPPETTHIVWYTTSELSSTEQKT